MSVLVQLQLNGKNFEARGDNKDKRFSLLKRSNNACRFVRRNLSFDGSTAKRRFRKDQRTTSLSERESTDASQCMALTSSLRASYSLSSCTPKQSRQRKIHFDLFPEIAEKTSYTITKELAAELWYSNKELQVLNAQRLQEALQIVTGKCNGDSCPRGLEGLIHDQTTKNLKLKQKRSAYVQGLIQLQKDQQQQLLREDDVEHALRTYAAQETKKNASLAKLLASRDAVCAFRIYQETMDWKMPRRVNDLRDSKSNVQATPSTQKRLPREQ